MYVKEKRTNNENFMKALRDCLNFLDDYEFMCKQWNEVLKLICQFTGENDYLEYHETIVKCVYAYYNDDPDNRI